VHSSLFFNITLQKVRLLFTKLPKVVHVHHARFTRKNNPRRRPHLPRQRPQRVASSPQPAPVGRHVPELVEGSGGWDDVAGEE